jgi:hypothetical protein
MNEVVEMRTTPQPEVDRRLEMGDINQQMVIDFEETDRLVTNGDSPYFHRSGHK